jgi:hypothetical protein
MRKLLTALVAVMVIGAAAVTTSSPASAWRGGWGGGWGGWGWRGGWGWGPGPFVAGAAVGALAGAAIASPYYGYGPYPYAYGPYPYPYAGYYGCPRVWNGYYWVAACY